MMRLFLGLVLVMVLSGCGHNDLRVTLSGDETYVSQTSLNLYKDGSVYDSYTGRRSQLYSNAAPGDYYAKATCLGTSFTSPTLTIAGKPILGTMEYKIDIYVFGSAGRVGFTEGSEASPIITR